MTREEAKAEINKVFEPAFANYIITALTEGATPSEHKMGEWKPIDLTFGRHFYYCTACEETANEPIYEGKLKFKYCPSCGAKMKVGE